MTGATWWGSTELELDAAHRFRIGSLELIVERHAQEWLVQFTQDGDWLDERVESGPVARLEDTSSAARFISAGDRLRLAPALPERPVVTRPEHTLMIPPGARAKLYVSVPLWVHGFIGDAENAIFERSINRVKRTWYGPNTIEGELCYASRTFARLTTTDLVRPHRALGRVVVDNKNPTPIEIERMQLPVTLLSLYERQGSPRLWFDDLFFVRESADDDAGLRLDNREWRRAPEGATLLTPARVTNTQRLLRRVFSPFIAVGKEG